MGINNDADIVVGRRMPCKGSKADQATMLLGLAIQPLEWGMQAVHELLQTDVLSFQHFLYFFAEFFRVNNPRVERAECENDPFWYLEI